MDGKHRERMFIVLSSGCAERSSSAAEFTNVGLPCTLRRMAPVAMCCAISLNFVRSYSSSCVRSLTSCSIMSCSDLSFSLITANSLELNSSERKSSARSSSECSYVSLTARRSACHSGGAVCSDSPAVYFFICLSRIRCICFLFFAEARDSHRLLVQFTLFFSRRYRAKFAVGVKSDHRYTFAYFGLYCFNLLFNPFFENKFAPNATD